MIFLTILLCFSIYNAYRDRKFLTFKEIFIPNLIFLHMYLSTQSFFVVFNAFNCIKLFGLPNQMIYYEYSIECWDEEHKNWTLNLALPILIIWIILFPLALFIKIFLNLDLVRKDDKDFMEQYGVITKTLNDNCFYWEFLTYTNKMLSAIVITFLARMTEGLCGLFLLMGLIYGAINQNRTLPYRCYIFFGGDFLKGKY